MKQPHLSPHGATHQRILKRLPSFTCEFLFFWYCDPTKKHPNNPQPLHSVNQLGLLLVTNGLRPHATCCGDEGRPEQALWPPLWPPNSTQFGTIRDTSDGQSGQSVSTRLRDWLTLQPHRGTQGEATLIATRYHSSQLTAVSSLVCIATSAGLSVGTHGWYAEEVYGKRLEAVAVG